MDNIEQAVRISHCAANPIRKHDCIGSCKITPSGVILECSLCGSGDNLIQDDPKFKKLTKILNHIKVNIDLINIQTIQIMMEEL